MRVTPLGAGQHVGRAPGKVCLSFLRVCGSLIFISVLLQNIATSARITGNEKR